MAEFNRFIHVSREEFELLYPTEFMEQIAVCYSLWAFGQEPPIQKDAEALVEAWNDRHADEWILTEEETPSSNFKMFKELWQKEMLKMIKLYKDSLKNEVIKE